MKQIRRFLQAIFSIYGFIVFILILFIVFPFVVIASLFGKVRGGNIIYIICTLWSDAAFFAWGMFHRNIYESPHNTSHACVFVFNHISYIDIPLLLKAFRKQHIRVLGKAEMSKIPVFGYLYKKSAIMVDRSCNEARARSVEQLKWYLNQNISVVLAPEGTFNLTNKPLKEFYDGAFRIAIETKTPIKPVVFPDAYDRLNYHSVFTLCPGRTRAVFLEEVKVNELTMEDLPALKLKVYKMMEDALIKYKASWIK